MKLAYFYAKLHGPATLRLATDETLMCKRDFWQKHRMGAEWDAEIDTIWVEPAEGGKVACIVTLKAA